MPSMSTGSTPETEARKGGRGEMVGCALARTARRRHPRCTGSVVTAETVMVCLHRFGFSFCKTGKGRRGCPSGMSPSRRKRCGKLKTRCTASSRRAIPSTQTLLRYDAAQCLFIVYIFRGGGWAAACLALGCRQRRSWSARERLQRLTQPCNAAPHPAVLHRRWLPW